MPQLPKTLAIPEIEMAGDLPEPLKKYLRLVIAELKKQHRQIYNDIHRKRWSYFYDPSDGSEWRIRPVNGDLDAQKKVSGVWTQKGGFTA